MAKSYKLNPKPKKDEQVLDDDGNPVIDQQTGKTKTVEVEVDVDAEDRTIVITEEVDQSLLDQLPESVRSQIKTNEERVTIANLKNEHVGKVEAAKNAIKKANELARKINDISFEFPELGIKGKPAEILDGDKMIDLDSKKPTLRKKKAER